MKGFKLTKDTTLTQPDIDGEIGVEMIRNGGRVIPEHVSFEKLRTWVASVETQIIAQSYGLRSTRR